MSGCIGPRGGPWAQAGGAATSANITAAIRATGASEKTTPGEGRDKAYEPSLIAFPGFG